MMQVFGLRGSVAAMAALLGLTAAAPAGAPSLAAVARIEPGLWQIKTLGSDAAPRSVCVADPSVLLHYGRRTVACEHSIVTNEADLATVQYRCAGSATGRATFHVATPRAFNLDLQGLEGGLPFDDSYEAHRMGNCTRTH